MKTYKNITNADQLDIPPGETGERDIPLDQEERMVDRGAITVVGETTDTPAETTTTDAPDEPTPGGDEAGEKTPEQIEAEQKAAADAEAAERDAAQRGRRGRS